MRRRRFLAAVVGLVVPLAGCGGPKPYSPLTTAELEKDMAGRLGYQEVRLTDKGNGLFTGTGKKDTGEVHELSVTQTGNRLKWEHSYKDATGQLRFQGGGEVSR